jgi:hypothetical protein
VHTATYDYRKKRNLLSDDDVAYELRDLLIANADAGQLTDASGVALINDELREAVFGPQRNGNGNGGKAAYDDDVLDELNDTVGELTRPVGKVYWLLEESGHTLCTMRVRRKAQLGSGATVVVAKMGRFVTQDADVAMAYRLGPEFDRVEAAVGRVMRKAIEDAHRIPPLATKILPRISAAQQEIVAQLAAPMPTQNGNGSTP